tara:strand:+ start:2218 stop:2511 length:294 start_codon:yes stop_codon:yes gene_type:complete
LPSPHVDELLIPDLRIVEGQELIYPNAEFLDLIKIMFQRQDWYKEYLKLHFAEPNPVVGKFSARTGHLDSLLIPEKFLPIEITGFSLEETTLNVHNC